MSMTNPNSLPPGFRFHPTDEELILHYLKNRAASTPCPVSIIAEVDIYKFDPWDLPAKAVFGDREWYFFSPRDRKYPNGIRPNRAAASGYWKATGTDKPIRRSNGDGNENIGVKKALVFYQGRPPKGQKTNWIMHEYRIAEPPSSNSYRPMKFKDASMRLDDRVLCRIYKKSTHQTPPHLTDLDHDNSGSEEISPSNYQPEPQILNDPRLSKSFSLSEFLVDYSNLSGFFDNSDQLLVPHHPDQFIHGDNNTVQHVMTGESHLSVNGEGSLKRQRENDYLFDEGNNIIDGMQQNLYGQPLYGQGQILFGSNFKNN